MSGCKVCTIDYLYKLNQGTGLYEFFSAVAADFSSGACSVTNQTAVFTDSFPGLTAPDNWKFVATGKSSSVSSPCSNPTGFSILKTQFFTSP